MLTPSHVGLRTVWLFTREAKNLKRATLASDEDGPSFMKHVTKFFQAMRRLKNDGNSRFRVFWPMARDEIARSLHLYGSYEQSISFCRNARDLLGGVFTQLNEYERELGTRRHDGKSSALPDHLILWQHSVQLLDCLCITAIQQQTRA
jgi:hypothetical protein